MPCPPWIVAIPGVRVWDRKGALWPESVTRQNRSSVISVRPRYASPRERRLQKSWVNWGSVNRPTIAGGRNTAVWRSSSCAGSRSWRLTDNIVSLATEYGRYGYRRITALLKTDGWRVNHKRVERIWRQEGQ
ncbi:MAG: hypothetical protein CME19_09195, partial [Gemmatimonadetes bacterium]|nr:hypothetical protein [Gemmatimonadota bacterium]